MLRSPAANIIFSLRKDNLLTETQILYMWIYTKCNSFQEHMKNCSRVRYTAQTVSLGLFAVAQTGGINKYFILC